MLKKVKKLNFGDKKTFSIKMLPLGKNPEPRILNITEIL